MSLFGRIEKLARSPQGKKLMTQAQQLANDPRTKRRIDEARRRLTNRGKPPPA